MFFPDLTNYYKCVRLRINISFQIGNQFFLFLGEFTAVTNFTYNFIGYSDCRCERKNKTWWWVLMKCFASVGCYTEGT